MAIEVFIRIQLSAARRGYSNSFPSRNGNFENLQLNFQGVSACGWLPTTCDSKELQPRIAASSGRLRLRKTLRCVTRHEEKRSGTIGYAALRLRRVRLDSKAAILIKLLASTAAPTHNSNCSRPSARQRFMPRPRKILDHGLELAAMMTGDAAAED